MPDPTDRDREVAREIADTMRVEWMQEEDEHAHLSSMIATALAQARAEEREACARECEAAAALGLHINGVSDLIRARGEEA